jgi:hypothetical protein
MLLILSRFISSRKREVQFVFFVLHTTQDQKVVNYLKFANIYN